MKDMKELEKRMYFFVPYNLSPIQQAIQAGHAALEYALQYGKDPLFKSFAKDHKTWIILNGGTTNDNYSGPVNGLCLQEIWGSIDYHNDFCPDGQTVQFSAFREPDLNNALTAVCFIADERVFNYEDYPDFTDWIRAQDFVDEDEKLNSFMNLENLGPKGLKELFPGMYPQWVRQMGGERNIFLRELLRGKKLA
jgi:hypothetical protein